MEVVTLIMEKRNSSFTRCAKPVRQVQYVASLNVPMTSCIGPGVDKEQLIFTATSENLHPLMEFLFLLLQAIEHSARKPVASTKGELIAY